jgi:hypothetical protein
VDETFQVFWFVLWVLCGKNRKWDFGVKLVSGLVFFLWR